MAIRHRDVPHKDASDSIPYKNRRFQRMQKQAKAIIRKHKPEEDLESSERRILHAVAEEADDVQD